MSEEAAVRREVVRHELLIVDDEQSIPRDLLERSRSNGGMRPLPWPPPKRRWRSGTFSHRHSSDGLKLQQTNGVELLKQVHDVHPEVAVVVLTQYGTIESALEVTRIGAVTN